MKAKNYASAMKLISHALTDNTLTESERKTLTDTLEECKKQGGVDTFPLNVVCPNCDSRLPYGTATPICKSCNQQLLFCFHSLKVILARRHKKCDSCSAVYFPEYALPKCEYCYLGNVVEPF